MTTTTRLKRAFSTQEYHQMYELGILAHDERVELIAGEIIQMSPIGRRHAATVDRLSALFTDKLAKKVILRVQGPIALEYNSEPQPDITLLKRKADFYESGHPQPEDIFLIVEVADSTVNFDREVKFPLYAKHNITEAWLVNLEAQQLEIYRTPTPHGYADVQIHTVELTNRSLDQLITILAFPKVEISFAEIFAIV